MSGHIKNTMACLLMMANSSKAISISVSTFAFALCIRDYNDPTTFMVIKPNEMSLLNNDATGMKCVLEQD